MATLALKILADYKAVEPVLLEVKEHCSFADYFIICSGGSRRQVTALAEHLREELAQQAGVKPLGAEGLQDGLWVLMDYNTVVIHIFFQELRAFYDLEGLWADSPRTYAMPPSAAAISPLPTVQKSASTPESGSGSLNHD